MNTSDAIEFQMVDMLTYDPNVADFDLAWEVVGALPRTLVECLDDEAVYELTLTVCAHRYIKRFVEKHGEIRCSTLQ